MTNNQYLIPKAEPLKIALLCLHSSPLGQPGAGDTGGMSIYVQELTRELAKQGHLVDIFTRCREHHCVETVSLVPGARLVNIREGEPRDLDKLLVYASAPDFACKMENFRKQNDLHYDVVLSHYWISGIAGLYLQAWWQVPHLVTFHTLGFIKNSLGIGEDESELRIEEEGCISRDCTMVIASTERERRLLHDYYKVPLQKITVIPCGVNLNIFRPLDKAMSRRQLSLGDRKVMLFVGRIERLKGVDKIVEALPHLADIQPELVIVGEDGNRPGEVEVLKKLAQELKVTQSVHFRGLVPHEQLPTYYSAADVFVFPSYYESFGLVPLESLACGTPVVATAVGDLPNIIREGETGYILRDNNPQQIADRLRSILCENSSRIASAAAIRESVVSYGWASTTRSITRLCQELTKQVRLRCGSSL